MNAKSPPLRLPVLVAILLAATLAGCERNAAPSTLGPAAPPAAERAPTASPVAVADPLSRVAVVGASVSRGFGSGISLAAAFQFALGKERERVLDASSGQFFLDPLRFGESQLEKARIHRATMIVAVDFLFWFAARVPARGPDETTRRLERLAEGLELLAEVEVPLLLGDLPDMTGAQHRSLRPEMLPSSTALAALNRAIREFAASRENVCLVPTSKWMTELRRGEWTLAAATDGSPGSTVLTPELVLRADRLHPTKLGVIALTDRLVATGRAHFGEIMDSLRFDPAAAIRTGR
jgi:hypothetical protein